MAECEVDSLEIFGVTIQDLNFSFLAQFSGSSNAYLIARLTDTTIIVVKKKLCYLLPMELGYHTDEQRSLLFFALSTLIAGGTLLQDTQTQVSKNLPAYTEKIQSFAAFFASITTFSTKHHVLRELIQKAQSYVVQAREREDKMKATRGKVADLEEQISHLKTEITKLKAEEASLMPLEYNLLVVHMIDKGCDLV
ncbi:hypothetical protein GH714_038669 [Hevea brasiliensis]|uniref:Uncharacterized protein n=1 Tax=Hevea brasiliensis TaxID=3981 RepID=A0A6A6LSL7_HEVBR|nr:hypothetical protein GH714_038669 [Hevea brasiliensis]